MINDREAIGLNKTSHWLRYGGQAILKLVLLLIVISMLTFGLLQMSPIDPVQAYVGADLLRVSVEQREEIAAYWGLEQGAIERYKRWASAVLTGDLGTSAIYRQPVTLVIGERFKHSLWLMGTAWILSGLFGFIAGIVAAFKRDTWVDRLIKSYCYTLASAPTFWIGLLVLMVFAVWLGWFPIGLGSPAGKLAVDVSFTDRLVHMMLPALTLSFIGIANIALHTREKVVDILESEFIMFARARGMSGFKLLWHHGLRHAALPAMTLQFASFSELFGGAVLAEQVFSYPGLGQATVEAGLRGDVPLLLGLVLFSAIFVFVGNQMADVMYRFIDPRMKVDQS